MSTATLSTATAGHADSCMCVPCLQVDMMRHLAKTHTPSPSAAARTAALPAESRPVRTASPAAVKYLTSLVERTGYAGAVPTDPAGVSKLIDTLKAAPRKENPKPAADLTPGMYRKGEDIYRVQTSRQSGRLYAKHLVHDGERWTLVYAAGAVATLTVAQRMTLAEAEVLSKQYGVCIRCGRELENADSVAAGIGPVCAKNI